jgi:hypothetical protein
LFELPGMLPSQPHSLFVRDRTQISDPAGTSIDHLRGEMQFLRESKEYRIAIEKELVVWMDLLMESKSVDRKTLKRSVSHWLLWCVHDDQADSHPLDGRVSILPPTTMIRSSTSGT